MLGSSHPELVNVLVLVLNAKVSVGVLVVADPTGTEPATSTAYVTLGPLAEAEKKGFRIGFNTRSKMDLSTDLECRW